MKKSIFSNKITVVALAMIVSLLWGTLFPMIKIGYSAFGIDTSNVASIILFAGLRFFISGIILVLIISAPKKRISLPHKNSLWAIGVVSMLTVILHYALTYTGLSLIESSKSSILKQIGFLVLPCFIFLFRKEDRFSVRKVAAAVLGFIATLVLSIDGLSFSFGLGEALIVAASFSVTIGQVTAKNFYDRFSPAFIVAWAQLFGGAVMLLIGALLGGGVEQLDAKSIAVLAYICAASISANLIWNTLIKYNDMSYLAVLKSADPLFAVVLSGLLLHENIWKWNYLLALIIITAAVLTVNFKKKAKNSIDQVKQ
jgi:drug/metabolite transporter (DMT)-like permease